MYRNMKYFIFGIVFTAILLVSIGTLTINNISWKSLLAHYNDTKEDQVDYYINTVYKDLESLLISHSVWTDAIVALNKKDSEWLTENATKYIVDDKSYNIDFIYITSEDRTFTQTNGEDYEKQVTMTKSFTDALYKDKLSSEIVWINEIPILIIASPFLENDYKNPTGCYIIARKIDEEELKELQYIFGKDESSSISITKEPVSEFIKSSNYKEIAMSFPIEFEQSKDYINITLSTPTFNYIFNKNKKHTLVVITVILIISTIVLLINLKKIVNTIILVINGVEEISNGNYKKHIKKPKSRTMPELDRLVNSVNNMSKNIENNMEVIGEQIKTINQKYHEMIDLIVNTVEMNDTYTYQHSISVSKYALIIGKAIGYKDLKNLELAAKLHDIGKISIPTHILNKPGSLTDEEYELIKKHPDKGYILVNKIDEFKGISEAIKYHHERYDGKGYPKGLEEDNIPLMAQIISIADVYDALTSDRSYRKAMTCKDAMKIILNESGKMFNKKLVDVFYEEIKKIESDTNIQG